MSLISVKDKPPDEGSAVLVYTYKGQVRDAVFIDGEFYASDCSWIKVKYWRQMIELPEEEK